jgi:alpha-L-rhamnosidase
MWKTISKDYKVMYLAYDVTSMLSEGENVVGAILGNGFYNPRMFWCEGYGTTRFLGQLHITYTDGSEEVVVSDESWKAAKSPILKNMVYYGETYDARLEQADWCKSGFDAASWENAVIREAPFGKLVAHTSPADKVMEQLQPVKIEKLENGNYFVDFGKEISGWVRLKMFRRLPGIKLIFHLTAICIRATILTFLGEKAPKIMHRVLTGLCLAAWKLKTGMAN